MPNAELNLRGEAGVPGRGPDLGFGLHEGSDRSATVGPEARCLQGVYWLRQILISYFRECGILTGKLLKFRHPVAVCTLSLTPDKREVGSSNLPRPIVGDGSRSPAWS